ncbi:MAG TPA: diguanylate cyclase [Vicinamibacterales bacterium]|nr:diguanylate cyclase [Vicinamibacterales bacterium]
MPIDLPGILAYVFGAIAAASAAWAMLLRRTMAREAELLQTIRERTEQVEEANRKLEALSYLDALTGVANRRAFDEGLDREWRRGIRSKRPLALLMMDIDCFKAFNDTYGHQSGDRCLANVAAALSSTVKRAGDQVARYGGEEFAALLPETDRPGAAAIAERMRAAVEQLHIPNKEAPGGYTTVSVGFAVAQATDAGTPDALLASADAALYRAKREGRNRTVEAVMSDPLVDAGAPSSA